jgi:hypothetical protein
MNKILLLAVVLVVGLTSFAHAAIDGGTREFGVNGYMDKNDQKNAATGVKTGSNETTSIGINMGYFLIKKLSLGALFSYDTARNESGATWSETKSYGLSAQLKVYPTMAEHTVVAPYFGLQFGANRGDYSNSGGGSGDSTGKSMYALAGIKYFPVDLASLNFELRYGRNDYTYKSGATSYDYEQDKIRLQIGASLYF